jgi:DNA invertase Pin-like site-specific DNA recombinase
MIYGYARVSTKQQAKDGNSLQAQTDALKAKGAEQILHEAYTGTTKDRSVFDSLPYASA